MEGKKSAEEILEEIRGRRDKNPDIDREYTALGEKLEKKNITDVYSVETKVGSKEFIDSYFTDKNSESEKSQDEMAALERIKNMLKGDNSDIDDYKSEDEEKSGAEETAAEGIDLGPMEEDYIPAVDIQSVIDKSKEKQMEKVEEKIDGFDTFVPVAPKKPVENISFNIEEKRTPQVEDDNSSDGEDEECSALDDDEDEIDDTVMLSGLKRLFSRHAERESEASLDAAQEDVQEIPQEIRERESDEVYPDGRDDIEPYLSNRKMLYGIGKWMSLIVLAVSCAYHLLQSTPYLPQVLKMSVHPRIYSIVSIGMFAVSIVFSLSVVGTGLKNLISRKFTAESAIGLPVILMFILSCICVASPQGIALGKVQIYTLAPMLTLWLSNVARYTWAKQSLEDYRYLLTDERSVVDIVSNERVSRVLESEMGCPTQNIGIGKKWVGQKEFIRRTDSLGIAFPAMRWLAVIPMAIAVVTLVAVGIRSGDMIYGISAAASVLSVSIPCAAAFLIMRPMKKEQMKLRRYGTVLMGYSGACELWNLDAVVCTDRDILPEECVGLGTIKTFGDGRIDKVIIYAASICKESDNDMWPLFEQIIQGKDNLLEKTEELTCDPEVGIECYIDSKRICFGTRHQLAKRGIDTPSGDYENKHCTGGRKGLYLSVNGEIEAMFVMEYNVSQMIQDDVEPLMDMGMGLIVNTSDPVLTKKNLCDIFDRDERAVTVLPQRIKDAVCGSDATELSPLVFKGSFQSMLAGVRSSGRIIRSTSVGTAMQTVGSIVGLVLAAITCISFGGAQMSAVFSMLYSLGWAGLIWTVQTLM